MKRMLVLLTAFALLLGGAAAAEGRDPVLSEFEDFTLQTGTAPAYAGAKADGQPLFVFYLSLAGDVSASAVNAVWLRQTEPSTADAFTEMIRGAESGIRAQYAAAGNVLKGYTVGTASETELWGLRALVCDTELLIGVNDAEISLVQRSIRVTGAWGTYLFSLSAWEKSLLEEATDALVSSLRWEEASPSADTE